MRYLGNGNGSSGVIALGSYTQTWYSASGASGQSDVTVTGTFSAGDRIFIHQTRGGANVGKGEEATVASYTTGTLILVEQLDNTYTDSGSEQAQIAVVEQASSITGTYSMTAWDGDTDGMLYISCNGTSDIIVDGNAKGYRGGDGGIITGHQGEGSVGFGGSSGSANGNGGGGGTNFQNTPRAGGGGHANAGETKDSAGGLAVGTATLTTLYPGGGAGGFSAPGGPGVDGGDGGNGGAIIVINTHTITATSSLSVNGENGSISGNGEYGGSGGAGGSILLRCVKNLGVTLSSTKGVGVNGSEPNSDGSEGSEGRIRIETCSNVVGTEDPTASLQAGGFSYCGGSAFII